jgi:hypothetical protein
MARKRVKKSVERPKDNLPPAQLQKAWNKYLDAQLGHPKHRPNFEVLVTPHHLELLAEHIPEDWMKLEPSPRMQVFAEALRRSLPKLTLMQQLVVKKYYGIEKEPRNEPEIAADLGISSQQMVSKYLARSKKRLKRLITSELSKIVREQTTAPNP